MQALADRRDELRNVKVCIDSHVFDPGWLQPGWGDSFYIVTEQFLGLGIDAYNDHLNRLLPAPQYHPYPQPHGKRSDPKPIDVILILVSLPDANGFCSFGYAPWDKAKLASLSKVVLAQVDETQIRTHGSNYIHVDDIDMIVEHTDPLLSDEEAAQTINAAPQSPNVTLTPYNPSPQTDVPRRAHPIPASIGSPFNCQAGPQPSPPEWAGPSPLKSPRPWQLTSPNSSPTVQPSRPA